MVVFTCGHCGESVQKPKVEKHYSTVCRNRQPNLSCMDCFKDFLGNEYEGHTKCVTEEERYSGKGFMAKEKKGEKKQSAWVEMVQSVLDEQKSASKNVLRIIETISKHNNTPRKKPKFVNFVKNVCGHKTNPKDIDQAWDLISVKLAALSKINEQNRAQPKDNETSKSNGHSEDKEGEEDKEHDEEEKINGDTEHNTNGKVNGVEANEENGEVANGGTEEEIPADKKLSKKQRKEEKKRKKYEAELQSAEQPPVETEEVEVQKTKKEKKKNRTNSVNDENVAPPEGKNKNKKRKRQDTVGAISDSNDNDPDVEVKPVKKEIEKKKPKVVGEDAEADESICLHDQNVAKIEEVNIGSGNFNWHAAIMSVLEKKGNEVPFKRLQKKVLSEYAEATGCDIDDRIADKFIKKLKSAPNVRVDKNRVLLLTDD